ncbi:hypothetical protein PCC7424_1858 [Gloeothece citriformis PCC 7424]|uniref:DUF4435 domain-containing protein n=1 Tax=Gloeothece citriformis (strain PCC 7424) TaxID=65393 RepID=B7KCI5_GLOC7|nr:hypothetical protein [Gloeothece citriformis]ACK70290.1 hypothetical protein PCC7424_1858 [Gloeothece citriformis PCC 7424]
MEIYRRSLDELLARYELEPTLRDVYVEGLTDKVIIEWFLEQCKQTNYAVYDIDTVEIPAELLFSEGLVDNNRSRVIFLALYIEKHLSNSKSVICIADRDFSLILNNENISSKFLLFTDYTSMDIYLFNEVIIEKFCRLVLRIPNLVAKDVLDNLSQVLEELFLIRATNQILKLEMEWLSFDRCCSFKDNLIEFQTEIFIERYLNKNGKIAEKNLFIAKFRELRTSNIIDIRYKIRGKDFLELLCWYIKPYLSKDKRSFSELEVVRGSLLGCLELNFLLQENLFEQLLQRVSS